MKRSCGLQFMMVWVVVLTLTVPASRVRADFAFGQPVNLGPAVNGSSSEVSPSISADGLSLYFASNRPGGSGEFDLWVSTRPTTDTPWGPAVNLGPSVNSQYAEVDPSISSDGLSLYFSDPHKGTGLGRPRPGGFAPGDGGNVWVVTRTTILGFWSTPVNLGSALNSRKYDQVVQPSISADGLSLYVHACAQGIGVAKRASTADLFGTPELFKFAGNNSSAWWPNISADERVLLYSRWTGTIYELWATTRPTANSDFGPPTKLPASLNISGTYTLCPSLSTDGSTLYFVSDRPGGIGGYDLWQVSITPVVDFNADGEVDVQDLLRMIESWGQNDPSADIAPPPFGDDIVDEKDLEVLMGYWGQEIPSPALIAQWKLDEAEGVVAVDSAGANDGVLLGNPLWQPTGGKLDGALQLDGVGDCVTTEFVRDPSEGPFSVFAWVKGGAPGQVIVSQEKGANWLTADTSDGVLATEFKSSGRTAKALKSAVSITDGAWHRIGLVWDGSNRILYADDIEVASDAQAGLTGTYKGLYLGAGSTLAPASFWSGLIDEVRIYNRAVKP